MNFMDIDRTVLAEIAAKYAIANVSLELFCSVLTLVLDGHLLLSGSLDTQSIPGEGFRAVITIPKEPRPLKGQQPFLNL